MVNYWFEAWLPVCYQLRAQSASMVGSNPGAQNQLEDYSGAIPTAQRGAAQRKGGRLRVSVYERYPTANIRESFMTCH